MWRPASAIIYNPKRPSSQKSVFICSKGEANGFVPCSCSCRPGPADMRVTVIICSPVSSNISIPPRFSMTMSSMKPISAGGRNPLTGSGETRPAFWSATISIPRPSIWLFGKRIRRSWMSSLTQRPSCPKVKSCS